MKNLNIFIPKWGFILILTCILPVITLTGCKLKNDQPPPPAIKKITPQVTESNIVFEEPNLPLPEPNNNKSPLQDVEQLPKVAIIIDDMGHHKKIGEQLLELDLNLTFSFLPSAPHTTTLKKTALLKNRSILVHLPMEAQDPKWDPGPDALYLSVPLAEIGPIVKKNLDTIQEASGVNNHMGSRFTENRNAVHEVLKVIKERKLFFIDSYTTVNSIAMDEAREMGIKTGRRDVFLDNIHNEKDICRQLEELIARAEEQGQAIGIGHPNKETLLALTRCRADLFKQVQLVGVDELVE